MAKSQELKLSILIGGKVDASLSKAVSNANKQLESMAKTIGNIGKAGLASMTALAGVTTKFLKDATEDAMKYETTMAEIAKVVDELKDDSGNPTSYYDEMKSGLKAMTTKIPVTFEGAGEIAAAFGQSGISSTSEILQYTADAAKMAIAFDTEAGTAGEWMATWKQAFGQTEKEIVELADQLNYLSNNTNATATDLAEIVTRVGSLGGMAGVNTSSVAALADVLVATGVDNESAATSLRNMFLKWTAGSTATTSEQTAMGKLGLDSAEFAQRMQDDAIGAIKDFFNRVSGLSQADQISVMNQYFGKRAVESATKLAQNMDMLSQNLEWIDGTEWQGSMENEYLTRSDTAENSIQLAQNAWRNLRETFGEAFLPVVKQAADWFVTFSGTIEDAAPTIANITGQIADFALNGLTVLSDALESLWKVAEKFLNFTAGEDDDGNKNSSKVSTALAGTALAFGAMSMAPQAFSLVSALTGGINSAVFGGKNKTLLGGSTVGGKGGGLVGFAKNAFSTVYAAREGAVLADNGTGATSLGDKLLGSYFGIKNKKGLTSTNDKTFFKATVSTFKQIKNAQSNGGILGILKNSNYGKNVANAFGGFKASASSVGANLGSIFGGVLSTTENVGGAGLGSILGGYLSAVKNVATLFNSGSNLAGTALSPLLSGGASIFAGLMSSFGPVIAGLGTVVAAVSLLGDNFEDVRTIIGNVFGEKGLTIFDTFTSKISSIGSTVMDTLKNAFSLENLQSIQQSLSGMSFFGIDDLGTTFGAVIPIIESVKGVIDQIVALGEQHIKPLLSEVFDFVINQFWPAVSPVLATIISIVGTVLVNAIAVIVDTIRGLLPVIEPVIMGIVGLVKSIATVAVKVINFIINALNKLSFDVPEWVAGIGGTHVGFNLKTVELPKFANGGFTNGVSIAGEAGTEAVISFKSAVRNDNIANWIKAGQMLGVSGSDAASAAGGFTDFTKAYTDYALKSNGIRTASDAITAISATFRNALAGDGSYGLAAAAIAMDIAPMLANRYFGNSDITSLITEAGKMFNGGTVVTGWNNGILYDSSTQLSDVSATASAGGSTASGAQFVFAPNITVGQGTDIESQMEKMFEKFKDMVKRELTQEQRTRARTAY